jgi:outer membrane protein OmpA-like peptidoglycan-associated protein
MGFSQQDLSDMKISEILAILLVCSLTACSALGSASSVEKEKELVENGYIALTAGDYRTAENLLKRALAINTKNPFTWLNLGVVYQDTRRYDEARQAYQTVIDLNPSQTAKASNVEGYSGKSLPDIARINLANLPPSTTARSSSGTSPDADADGVPDNADRCRNTPAGVVVGANGCWTLVDIFESGKAQIRSEAEGRLAAVITILEKNPTMHLEIQGHTDNRGARDLNQRLSEDRARSVSEYLTRKGIAADRLKWVGYGQSRPAVSNKTEDGRRQNRRVELVPIY